MISLSLETLNREELKSYIFEIQGTIKSYLNNGGNVDSFLDETDRLMSYSTKEKTIRQIWVERNGNRRIIKANILANGFPFQVDIQND